jgi:forkhead box protein N
MAIEDSLQKALPVKEIYAWIIQHFPYFKTAPTGWKNSVRHNLSLNKCFQKVEKAAVSSASTTTDDLLLNETTLHLQNLGKGSLWMVEPQYRPNLIQALTRSPFHPCSTWEKHAKNLIKTPSESPGSKVKKSNLKRKF